MGKISLGSTEIQRISLGSLEIQKVSLGLSDIWTTTASPVRMGLTLSADYDGVDTVWQNIPGWAVRSGFPSTNLSGNVFSNVPAGNYKASSNIIHAYQVDNFGVRLIAVATGAVLATITAAYNATNDFENTAFTHPGGDIRVEVWTGWDYANAGTIKAGSFVEIMPSALVTLQGVLKSSTQSIAANTWTLLAMGATDADHPGTTITTNGITIVGNGTVTVNAYARMVAANTSGNQIQMYKNGSPIGSAFSCNPAAQTAQWGGSFQHTFASGDLLQMYGFTDGLVANRREFTGDSTKLNTYFELTP